MTDNSQIAPKQWQSLHNKGRVCLQEPVQQDTQSPNKTLAVRADPPCTARSSTSSRVCAQRPNGATTEPHFWGNWLRTRGPLSCALRGWVGWLRGWGLALALGVAFDSALIKGCETQPPPAHSSESRGGGSGGAGQRSGCRRETCMPELCGACEMSGLFWALN